MKVVHISFADKTFYRSQQELIKSAKYFGITNNICYNHILLRKKKDFYGHNKSILNQKRGAGYWLWKPFIILDALKKLNDNDVLIYTDSGSKFINPVDDLINLLNFRDILLFYNNGHENRNWTKRDCFYYMNCDNSSFHNGNQLVAGYIFCKKTNFVINLMEEWLFYLQDARILTDIPNVCGLNNLEGFIEHRHDQSVLSILAHKYKIELFRDPSQWGNKYKLKKYQQRGEFLEDNKYVNGILINSTYPTIIDGHRISLKLTIADNLNYYINYFKK